MPEAQITDVQQLPTAQQSPVPQSNSQPQQSQPPNAQREDELGNAEPPWAPLTHRERAVALTLGMASGTTGVVAVFVSGNQAGTAALFLISIVLLLMGIQGTPLTRVGSGVHSAEFARRRWARALLEVADREEDPKVAAGVVRAAEVIARRPQHPSRVRP
ncbi:hypothetical protein [Nocardia crassostreae]|uniref:hypothetical protein n=1 Tax=Nocardia crassostreae TaxID=53428 RepID=UPI0008296B55|nr:hypothetical protein [Nocardia crassostreae]